MSQRLRWAKGNLQLFFLVLKLIVRKMARGFVWGLSRMWRYFLRALCACFCWCSCFSRCCGSRLNSLNTYLYLAGTSPSANLESEETKWMREKAQPPSDEKNRRDQHTSSSSDELQRCSLCQKSARLIYKAYRSIILMIQFMSSTTYSLWNLSAFLYVFTISFYLFTGDPPMGFAESHISPYKNSYYDYFYYSDSSYLLTNSSQSGLPFAQTNNSSILVINVNHAPTDYGAKEAEYSHWFFVNFFGHYCAKLLCFTFGVLGVVGMHNAWRTQQAFFSLAIIHLRAVISVLWENIFGIRSLW